MLQFRADRFLKATQSLETLVVLIEDPRAVGNPDEKKKLIGDGSVKRQALESLNDLCTSAVDLRTRLTEMAVIRLTQRIKNNSITFGDFSAAIRDISSRLEDELSEAILLIVDKDKKFFYDTCKPLFGITVENKFPSAAYDIEEAGRCFALGRNTASVFHLMRVMEIAIRAIARCLGISDPTKPAERNWGNILKTIKEGVEKKWPNSAARMEGDGALFERIYASLDAVKNPWRNATMHIENKYTDEEARHIFDNVKILMKEIAERMDERGGPKA